jgi:hypothetical protein
MYTKIQSVAKIYVLDRFNVFSLVQNFAMFSLTLADTLADPWRLSVLKLVRCSNSVSKCPFTSSLSLRGVRPQTVKICFTCHRMFWVVFLRDKELAVEWTSLNLPECAPVWNSSDPIPWYVDNSVTVVSFLHSWSEYILINLMIPAACISVNE